MRLTTKIAGIAVAASALVGGAALPANASEGPEHQSAHHQQVVSHHHHGPSWAVNDVSSATYISGGKVVLVTYFTNRQPVALSVYLVTPFGTTSTVTVAPGQRVLFTVNTWQQHTNWTAGTLHMSASFYGHVYSQDTATSYAAAGTVWKPVPQYNHDTDNHRNQYNHDNDNNHRNQYNTDNDSHQKYNSDHQQQHR
jgi:hypothetical protein